MAEAAPDWAKDMIVTELRREYPRSVGKDDLRDRCGIGPGDMRTALAELSAAGQVEDDEEGYRWVDPHALGPAPAAEDAEEGEDPPGDVGGPEELPAAVEATAETVGPPAADSRYEATLVVTVSYFPEPEEDEGDDVAAVREAGLIQDAAADGILAAFPSLPVAARVLKVEAFDNPRRVFPAEP